jgi:signal transduction histidine kinase
VSQEHLGLFDTPPDRRDIRLGLGVAALLFAAFVVIFPFHNVAWPEFDAFVPMINGFLFLAELIIATMLYAQASVFRSRSLTALASGFVFAALLLVPHALTFPGAFAEDGLLGAGTNTTAWIAVVRRTTFPAAVALYAVLKRAEQDAPFGTGRQPPTPVVAVAVAALLAIGATMLATMGHDWLPPLFLDRREGVHPNLLAVNLATIALSLIAMAMVLRTRRSVLDVWLMVALFGWLIQMVLNLPIQARFTVGFYGLFALTVLSNLIVMLALIAESNRLYARLVLSTSARSRERAARQMSRDALVTAITQEIGQPLSAIGTSARAALNWLARPQPDTEKAASAVRDTLDAVRRALDVIVSIGATRADVDGPTGKFDLNALVRETCAAVERELASLKIDLQLNLDESLPPIEGDRGQIRQVLLNLFANAIESLSATRGRSRRIALRTARLEDGATLLELSDNGVGLSAEASARIFDPFFTTKASGTGIGLALCQKVVEDHRGHIWVSPGEKHGVTFHVRLPDVDFDCASRSASR